MQRAVQGVGRCPSVRPSVCYTCVLYPYAPSLYNVATDGGGARCVSSISLPRALRVYAYGTKTITLQIIHGYFYAAYAIVDRQ